MSWISVKQRLPELGRWKRVDKKYPLPLIRSAHPVPVVDRDRDQLWAFYAEIMEVDGKPAGEWTDSDSHQAVKVVWWFELPPVPKNKKQKRKKYGRGKSSKARG